MSNDLILAAPADQEQLFVKIGFREMAVTTKLNGVEVELRFRADGQGGRSTPLLIAPGTYRPHFVVQDGQRLGVVVVRGPSEPVSPGALLNVEVGLPYEVSYEALAEGATFDVMEGTRLVAQGRVLRLL